MQTLLRAAHEVELQRQKEVEKLERQLALPPAEQAATQVSAGPPPACPPCLLLPRSLTSSLAPLPQESAFQEMCQGLLEESDGEGELAEGQDRGLEAGGDQAEGAEASPAVRLASLEKKTEQQRRREKAARMLVSTVGPGLLPLLLQLDFCLQPVSGAVWAPPSCIAG